MSASRTSANTTGASMGETASMGEDQEIRMIRDSAAAVAPPGGDLRRVRALRFTSPGFDIGVWREMCALGWVGLRLPEAEGGAGLGIRAFCGLAEEMGGGLVPEPLIETALAARLCQGGDGLSALLAGERMVLPALQERAGQFAVEASARFQHGRVEGKKLFIPGASAADAFVVTTRDGVVLVDRTAAGLHLAIEATQDGGEFGTLTLEGAPGVGLAASRADVELALEEAAVAAAATLLGMMDRVFALTLAFLQTRHQFGKSIGSFQALQHKAADLKIQIELTRASVAHAARVCDAGAPRATRAAAVSRAKARASDAAMLVTRQAIQLHGGIGYTDEYDAGLFLRRAMVLAPMYGAAAAHRARFAAFASEADEE